MTTPLNQNQTNEHSPICQNCNVATVLKGCFYVCEKCSASTPANQRPTPETDKIDDDKPLSLRNHARSLEQRLAAETERADKLEQAVTESQAMEHIVTKDWERCSEALDLANAQVAGMMEVIKNYSRYFDDGAVYCSGCTHELGTCDVSEHDENCPIIKALQQPNLTAEEMMKDKERLLTLAKLVWQARYENEDSERAVDLASMAAEIESGNFQAIDTAIKNQTKG